MRLDARHSAYEAIEPEYEIRTVQVGDQVRLRRSEEQKYPPHVSAYSVNQFFRDLFYYTPKCVWLLRLLLGFGLEV